MKKRVISFITLSLLLIAPASEVDSGEKRSWSIDELVERALSANPDVEALSESVGAARHRRDAAGGFPDPTLSYSHFIESVETRLGPQRNVLQLVQPVPFPGKLSLMKEIAGYEARIMEERLASARPLV